MDITRQQIMNFASKALVITTTICITIMSLFLIQGCQHEKNPVVSTGVVSAITGTTATCGGTVEDNGASISVRGVCYNTDGRPDINDPHTTDGSGCGDFRSYLTGLQPNTTYYVRAYAGNENGLTYGNEVSFSTINGDTPDDPDNPISITTKPVTNIACASAESGGTIIVGFAFASKYGVCYNTTGAPTLNDQYTIDNYYFPNDASSSDYTSLLTDLQPNTTYYVRAYAISNYGVTYGNEVSFTTSDPMLLTIPQGWKLFSAISSPAYAMSNGTYLSDLMNGYLYDCEKDDIIVFSQNGTHKVLPGTLLCSDDWEFGYNQETNLGQWYFDNASSPTFLNMQIPFFYNDYGTSYSVEMEKCRIIILNSNMLKISAEFCDDENPAKGIYTFTLTYVPAQ